MQLLGDAAHVIDDQLPVPHYLPAVERVTLERILELGSTPSVRAGVIV
jgi:hypothetical protein